MRQLSLGLLCSATFLLAGRGSNDKPPDGAMTVDPQRIVSEAGSIRTLHGEYSIRPARPNEPYMEFATNGGACLLAKIPVEGKSCTKQSDCNVTVPGQPQWYGYCLGAHQLPTTQGGTCWIKPSEQYCLKESGPRATIRRPWPTHLSLMIMCCSSRPTGTSRSTGSCSAASTARFRLRDRHAAPALGRR